MNNKDIKKMFLSESENINIDMSEKLKATPIRTFETELSTVKEKKRWSWKSLKPIYAFACCLLVLIGVMVFYPVSTVSGEITAYVIDINPSFSIATDKNDNIINICSLNDDADTVLSDQEFENVIGLSLDAVVEKIIKTVDKAGFFDDYQNTIQLYAINDNKYVTENKLNRFGEMIDSNLRKYGHQNIPYDKKELPLNEFRERMGFEDEFKRLDDMKKEIQRHDRFKGDGQPQGNGENPPPPPDGQPQGNGENPPPPPDEQPQNQQSQNQNENFFVKSEKVFYFTNKRTLYCV